jgi:hypothetical protein
MPALLWGIKYEQVASDAYAKKNGDVYMHEFGLIQHPEYSWLGASPDGISELGIMLEIKCPYKRKITGEIPEQYYYQIQGQLDVCDLDECDYLECEFIQYESRDEFQRHFNDNGNFKGVFIETKYTDPSRRHIYVPPKDWDDVDAQLKWLDDQIRQLPKEDVAAITFWQLHTYSVVRVYKDKSFIEVLYAQLQSVWTSVQNFKANKDTYDNYMNVLCPPKTQKKKPVFTRESISIETDAKFSYSKQGKDIKFREYAFIPE